MDENFGKAWEDVKLRINDVFTQHLTTKAKTKNGVIANLAILKYNESGSWIDQSKVNFQAHVIIGKSDVVDAKSYLEAEEIKPVARTVEAKPLISNQPASNNVLIEGPKDEI